MEMKPSTEVVDDDEPAPMIELSDDQLENVAGGPMIHMNGGWG